MKKITAATIVAIGTLFLLLGVISNRKQEVTFTPEMKTAYEEQAFQFFTENGLTPNQAVSVMTVIQSESNFDPTAKDSNGICEGLCGWSFQRLQSLKELATQNGQSYQDLEVQLQFILEELDPDSKYFRLANYKGYYPSDWFKQGNSLSESTTALINTYVRPALYDEEKLEEVAKSYYEKFA